MDQGQFEKYLKERYEHQTNWYDSKSAKNKSLYIFFQWAVIVLSAIVPVMVISFSRNGKWVTAGIAMILAVCTAALKTFKFQENWINYRTIAETLKKEKYFYQANLDDYADTSDKESLFIERVESLISREHSLWITAYTQKEKEEGKVNRTKGVKERRY